jgi:hypothetical protein
VAYDITLKTKVIGGWLNIFDSEHIRWIRGGVTIDNTVVPPDANGHRTLRLGQPLGKIDASGKYGPYNDAAGDGRQTALVMLGEDIDCTDPDGTHHDVVATAFDEARVIEARLPVAIDANGKNDLKGIKFV